MLSHENIVTPSKGKYYSVNEGNRTGWDEPTRRYIDYLKEKDLATGRPYSLRYIGSLVADFHRTLLYGGVFLYPGDYSNPKKPKAKLRLLYEVAPLAFLMEQAGGARHNRRGKGAGHPSQFSARPGADCDGKQTGCGAV